MRLLPSSQIATGLRTTWRVAEPETPYFSSPLDGLGSHRGFFLRAAVAVAASGGGGGLGLTTLPLSDYPRGVVHKFCWFTVRSLSAGSHDDLTPRR